MPICRHLKLVAYCPECRPQVQPKAGTQEMGYVEDYAHEVEVSKPPAAKKSLPSKAKKAKSKKAK